MGGNNEEEKKEKIDQFTNFSLLEFNLDVLFLLQKPLPDSSHRLKRMNSPNVRTDVLNWS